MRGMGGCGVGGVADFLFGFLGYLFLGKSDLDLFGFALGIGMVGGGFSDLAWATSGTVLSIVVRSTGSFSKRYLTSQVFTYLTQ